MSETTLKVPAKWTDDCQGKKDFDGDLVTLSTRYWPRGGGFTILLHDGRAGVTEFQENDTRPEIRPSAHSSIYIGSRANEYYDESEQLIEAEFAADTQEEVQRQVEEWAAQQFARIADALRREFRQ